MYSFRDLLFGKTIILSAGLPRSGSTLLFNLIREILIGGKVEFASGWEGDLPDFSSDSNLLLVKTHHLVPYWRKYAKYIFYTYRDIRSILVSSLKNWTFKQACSLIREHAVATRVPCQMFQYEEMIDSIPAIAIQIYWQLHDILPPTIDLAAASNRALLLKPPEEGEYSKITLLHPGHITGVQPDDWRTVLDPELQQRINKEFKSFFIENGYSL